MSLRTRSCALWLAAFALSSCGETGRDQIEIPLATRGTAAREVSVLDGRLLLSEAQVSFGPLYLCATESAESALCGTALAEQLSVLSIDALSEDTTPAPALAGTTGTVRSAFFDYGMSWLLTQAGPAWAAGLEHSARLRFSARGDDGSELEVLAEIDIAPLSPGDAAVNGRKTEHTLRPRGDALTVVLDANRWLERVRIAELFALDPDGDGHVVLSPESQAYEAILQGMSARFPPRFAWDE